MSTIKVDGIGNGPLVAKLAKPGPQTDHSNHTTTDLPAEPYQIKAYMDEKDKQAGR